MQNPEEQLQDSLFERIINNLTELNSSMRLINKELAEIDRNNEKTVLVAQLWENYTANAEFHLTKISDFKKTLINEDIDIENSENSNEIEDNPGEDNDNHDGDDDENN
ncbi:unnamed protein product [[Candida] boidinii]|uniref:DASH complex subunit DAD4 n=1 Tax=Candida boidinii TaxID=5477 RepID=A0A9W6T466_CANBO|nr:hypothetical protein B5S30_g397 [[Candida] boidinii]OWB84749.1 hypothetical protein B5S33_g3401 [[Candida] boidinii]GME74164.1 unnamed protein product [[Candida] boidinii]GMF50429.1 unnamed protein product [[Candida] boidinii]